ncbi:hypothetical protein ACS0PU_008330 [Formica fusca]
MKYTRKRGKEPVASRKKRTAIAASIIRRPQFIIRRTANAMPIVNDKKSLSRGNRFVRPSQLLLVDIKSVPAKSYRSKETQLVDATRTHQNCLVRISAIQIRRRGK